MSKNLRRGPKEMPRKFVASKQNVERLKNLNAVKYGKTGTMGTDRFQCFRLILIWGPTLNEVRNHVVKDANDTKLIEFLCRELGWRDFWSRFAENNQNLFGMTLRNTKLIRKCDYGRNYPRIF